MTFLDNTLNTSHLVGRPWTRNRPLAETTTWQHNIRQTQISMSPAGFQPKFPGAVDPALDGAATGIGRPNFRFIII